MKRIVIVGATSGIGLKVAQIYAAAGWKVGIAGRSEDRLKELASRYPGCVEWERIDVTSEEVITRLHSLIAKLGGMDIYFHSSGIFYQNPSLDPAKEIATVQTNVEGFTRLITAAFRYFRENGGRGQIAAITSVAGTKGIGEAAAYSASKRYQQNYLEALEQLATIQKLAIRFTDIRPGWTRTPLLEAGRNYPMSMDLDRVAALTVRAIRTRKRVAVIDLRWSLLTTLWRLLPSSLWTKLPLHLSSPKSTDM